MNEEGGYVIDNIGLFMAELKAYRSCNVVSIQGRNDAYL
jgi:hypothetical protein